jgi:hypothetical protein
MTKLSQATKYKMGGKKKKKKENHDEAYKILSLRQNSSYTVIYRVFRVTAAVASL